MCSRNPSLRQAEGSDGQIHSRRIVATGHDHRRAIGSGRGFVIECGAAGHNQIARPREESEEPKQQQDLSVYRQSDTSRGLGAP